MSHRTAGRTAGIAFIVSAIASVGLMVTYALGGQVQVEGILIFSSLGSMAVGFILWAKELMPTGEFVEARPQMHEPESEHRATAETVEEGAESVGRRRFIGRALAGAMGALGLAAIFPIRSLGTAPEDKLFRTAFRAGLRLVTPAGVPVKAEDLAVGGFLTVFPEGATHEADSQAVLIRAEPGSIKPVQGREDWSPDGYVVYSQICTHAGCPVTLYEPETKELLCPCHQSIFLVTDAARATYGPATRALPQLPIEIDDEGYVVARGDFSEPVGSGFWELG